MASKTALPMKRNWQKRQTLILIAFSLVPSILLYEFAQYLSDVWDFYCPAWIDGIAYHLVAVPFVLNLFLKELFEESSFTTGKNERNMIYESAIYLLIASVFLHSIALLVSIGYTYFNLTSLL